MRFLIVTKAMFPFPPEAAAGLVDATEAWRDRMTKEKKMEQAWSFAGINGGGGILNVNSAEELDAVMTEFPLGPFSEIQVYVLADIKSSLANLKRAIQQMTPDPRK